MARIFCEREIFLPDAVRERWQRLSFLFFGNYVPEKQKDNSGQRGPLVFLRWKMRWKNKGTRPNIYFLYIDAETYLNGNQ
ncbi:MAG: hypothetical protein BGO86_02025 [Chryseobacterium sp. 36-9]|nr:MAG: hypothetical protein BGO86_02025 [Chryseobacterium sp. 36-9]